MDNVSELANISGKPAETGSPAIVRAAPQTIAGKTAVSGRWRAWKRGLPLYIMILPGLLYFLIFRYLPMGGIVVAFQDYDPFVGFLKSDWVGLAHFRRLFQEPELWRLLNNTLLLNLLGLVLVFPAPIMVAILINEARIVWFRKLVQTVVFMPHFLSWIMVVSIFTMLLATRDGGVNQALASLGFQKIEFLSNPDYFRGLYVLQNIWKESGWHAIIFLAALATVDPSLYEAGIVDGASRWRLVRHITLPALKSTIIVLFILRLGNMIDIGYEHIYLIQNMMNLGVSDVFDTYVYRSGIIQMEYSYTTATGLFKAVVGLFLIIVFNHAAKKLGEEGVY